MLSEHQEQACLFKWVELQLGRWPELAWFYAIPNGADVSVRERKKLVDEGLRSGVADMHLPVARHGYHSLYIELKKVGGRDASKKQKEFRDFVIEQGNCWKLCYGAPEASKVISWYMG